MDDPLWFTLQDSILLKSNEIHKIFGNCFPINRIAFTFNSPFPPRKPYSKCFLVLLKTCDQTIVIAIFFLFSVYRVIMYCWIIWSSYLLALIIPTLAFGTSSDSNQNSRQSNQKLRTHQAHPEAKLLVVVIGG